MKSCFDIEEQVTEEARNLLEHDKIEIDNPDPFHPVRLQYMDRINLILDTIRKRYPNPAGTRVGDFACAQGNVALLLAEEGYSTLAVDINPHYLDYSKLKHEKGDVEWIAGSLDALNLESLKLDAAVAGEIIEHCAYPEVIIANIARAVRPGGILILTTPNGAKLRADLPTFRNFLEEEKRKELEERQFGPDGADHLFLFTREEMNYIVPSGTKIVEQRYSGSTVLVNKSLPLWRKLSADSAHKALRTLSGIPVINRKTFSNLHCVLQKVE